MACRHTHISIRIHIRLPKRRHISFLTLHPQVEPTTLMDIRLRLGSRCHTIILIRQRRIPARQRIPAQPLPHSHLPRSQQPRRLLPRSQLPCSPLLHSQLHCPMARRQIPHSPMSHRPSPNCQHMLLPRSQLPHSRLPHMPQCQRPHSRLPQSPQLCKLLQLLCHNLLKSTVM